VSDGISQRISVEIESARKPDRIGLDIAAEALGVGAEAVVGPAGLGVGVLAGQANVLGNRGVDRQRAERLIGADPIDALGGVGDQLRGAEPVVVVVEQARGGEEEANRLVAEIAVSPGRSAFRQLSRPGRLSCLPRAVSL